MSLNFLNRLTTASVISCGLLFLTLGSTETLIGSSVTWETYGSTSLEGLSTAIEYEQLHTAAPVKASATAGINVIIGTLFVLVGLFFHAFITLRRKPISDVHPRKIVRVLWMEIW
ncbi:MAG: hypothetical protein KAS32_18335 [Candidatus Peribacteraceae bacterium]|nr:hypothetical protein [Candidatus Peribacteraceae bacterium]